jgi:hypothetical protein
MAALIAFSNCMKGTVRGYDQYQPTRLSVVAERRTYLLSEKNVSHSEQTQTSVQLRFDTLQEAHTVEVRGTWDNWEKSHYLNKMPNIDAKVNMFCSSINLQVNREYEFKYILNGEW